MAAWRYPTLEVSYLRATCDSDMSSTSAAEEGDGTGSAFWSSSRRRLPAPDGLTVVVDRSIRSAIASAEMKRRLPIETPVSCQSEGAGRPCGGKCRPGACGLPGLSK